MAYNTKAIKSDKDGKPIPQVFSPLADDYEVLKGDAGAARQVLYDKDGNVVSVVSGKLAVRAAELEAALATLLTKAGFDAKADVTLSALRDALRGTGSKTLSDLATALGTLNSKDFATETTLAAILAKIISAPATEAKQDSLETVLKAIRDSAGIKKITDALPAGTNKIGKVDVDSSALPTGASTEATLALIKAKTDNIPSDPSKESGKLTALETLITTLNEKIDTLDAVIDSIKDTDGIKKITDTVDVQLSGSKMELYGKAISDRPAANTVPVVATFTIVDDKLDQNWISDGTNWEEV